MMKKNDNCNNQGHGHASLLAGLVAGVVIGALIAPVEGKKARKLARDKSRRLKKRVDAASKGLKDRPLADEVATIVERRLSETVKDQVPQLKKLISKRKSAKTQPKKKTSKKASVRKKRKSPAKKPTRRFFRGIGK